MSKIKLKDGEECLVTFVHINGEDSSYEMMWNPLTGDWLQTHKIGAKESSYYSDKTDAVRLLNQIVSKSADKGLRCDVRIQPRKTMGEY